MRVDVFFGIQQVTPADVQGRLVAVIDVLRASTSIAVALANGRLAVIQPLLVTTIVFALPPALRKGSAAKTAG